MKMMKRKNIIDKLNKAKSLANLCKNKQNKDEAMRLINLSLYILKDNYENISDYMTKELEKSLITIDNLYNNHVAN